jgi:hypothetical protein
MKKDIPEWKIIRVRLTGMVTIIGPEIKDQISVNTPF